MNAEQQPNRHEKIRMLHMAVTDLLKADTRALAKTDSQRSNKCAMRAYMERDRAFAYAEKLAKEVFGL